MHSTIELAMAFSAGGGILEWLLSPVMLLSDISSMIFFQRIHAFLVDEINEFRENLLGRTMSWVGGVALMALTIWILFQGFRIVTGQSRDSLTVFAAQSVKNAFILSAAMTMAAFGTDLDGFLTTGLVQEVHEVVTGDSGDPYSKIDHSLGYMQLAMSSIDAIDEGGDEIIADAKDRAKWFSGIGLAGPAIVGGSMLLLYRIAMALFIGLGPIFIACLMFDSTKPLFQKWLLYGIGTMFSLAVLSFTVSLALDVVIAVAASFWIGSFVPGSEGVSSVALQQGGVGLILTMLIVSAPPIAGNFFQATLANFSSYNQFGGGAPPGKPAVNNPYSNPSVMGSGSGSGSAPPPREASTGGGRSRDELPERPIQPSAAATAVYGASTEAPRGERGVAPRAENNPPRS